MILCIKKSKKILCQQYPVRKERFLFPILKWHLWEFLSSAVSQAQKANVSPGLMSLEKHLCRCALKWNSLSGGSLYYCCFTNSLTDWGTNETQEKTGRVERWFRREWCWVDFSGDEQGRKWAILKYSAAHCWEEANITALLRNQVTGILIFINIKVSYRKIVKIEKI